MLSLRLLRGGLLFSWRGAIALACSSTAALGQAAPDAAPVPSPSITTAPECRPGTREEIVVCGARRRGEQFRIPEALRDDRSTSVRDDARALSHNMTEGGRSMMPGSNSAVGRGGQSGEREAMLRDWYVICPKGFDGRHHCPREDAEALDRYRGRTQQK